MTSSSKAKIWTCYAVHEGRMGFKPKLGIEILPSRWDLGLFLMSTQR
jgi:hypothetical protein